MYVVNTGKRNISSINYIKAKDTWNLWLNLALNQLIFIYILHSIQHMPPNLVWKGLICRPSWYFYNNYWTIQKRLYLVLCNLNIIESIKVNALVNAFLRIYFWYSYGLSRLIFTSSDILAVRRLFFNTISKSNIVIFIEKCCLHLEINPFFTGLSINYNIDKLCFIWTQFVIPHNFLGKCNQI